jgi:hypothetical protein
MSNDNYDPVVDIEAMNQELISAIESAPDGHLKNASEASSKMVRRRIRENGFFRSIIPLRPVQQSELTRMPDSELPVIIDEMEPDSPGAVAIPFNDTADTAFFYGDKFVTYLAKISTREFTKNIDELRTYKTDIKAVITDNALKDIQTLEDSRGIATVDEIVGTPGVPDGAAGVVQNHVINSDITRASYTTILSHLEDLHLNNGVFLMNRKTAKKFLTWDRSEIGGDLAQSLLTEGLVALQKAKIMGVPHLFTIKRNLVADNVVYQFTEPNFLGKGYIYQDVTMYVEKKKDIIRFSAQEKIGFSIANVAGCSKTTFVP